MGGLQPFTQTGGRLFLGKLREQLKEIACGSDESRQPRALFSSIVAIQPHGIAPLSLFRFLFLPPRLDLFSNGQHFIHNHLHLPRSYVIRRWRRLPRSASLSLHRIVAVALSWIIPHDHFTFVRSPTSTPASVFALSMMSAALISSYRSSSSLSISSSISAGLRP